MQNHYIKSSKNRSRVVTPSTNVSTFSFNPGSPLSATYKTDQSDTFTFEQYVEPCIELDLQKKYTKLYFALDSKTSEMNSKCTSLLVNESKIHKLKNKALKKLSKFNRDYPKRAMKLLDLQYEVESLELYVDEREKVLESIKESSEAMQKTVWDYENSIKNIQKTLRETQKTEEKKKEYEKQIKALDLAIKKTNFAKEKKIEEFHRQFQQQNLLVELRANISSMSLYIDQLKDKNLKKYGEVDVKKKEVQKEKDYAKEIGTQNQNLYKEICILAASLNEKRKLVSSKKDIILYKKNNLHETLQKNNALAEKLEGKNTQIESKRKYMQNVKTDLDKKEAVLEIQENTLRESVKELCSQIKFHMKSIKEKSSSKGIFK